MALVKSVPSSTKYHISLIQKLVYVDDQGNEYYLDPDMRHPVGVFILRPKPKTAEPVKEAKAE